MSDSNHALANLLTAFSLAQLFPANSLNEAVNTLLDAAELAVDTAHGDERLGRTAAQVGREPFGENGEASESTASLCARPYLLARELLRRATHLADGDKAV